MTSNGVKLLNPKKPYMNGIFAVLKERGINMDDYKTWIRLTLHNESRAQFGSHGMKEIVNLMPKFTEPLATGVICVGLGHKSIRSVFLTRFWDHERLVTFKLGTETQYYTNDSPVTNQMPYDHITEDMLLKSLKSFIGTQGQINPPSIPFDSMLIQKESIFKPVKAIAKESPTPKVRDCRSIELISFDPPVVKLKVISDGYFSCRALVRDLGIKLGSCAHVTDLHLERMGLISVADCLQKHELHLNNIYAAIEKYTKMCAEDLKRFEELMPDNRRII